MFTPALFTRHLRALYRRLRAELSWPLVLFTALGVLARVWNYQNSLYFIYDQGRDAFVLQRMAHGDFVLVGPTTGLGGFFLGPLWYYLGLPGFALTDGHPYGIALWYMALSCIALPLFWILAQHLFSNKWGAAAVAVSLGFLPGSLAASLMIWNPLLSVTLMLGTVLCLARAKDSQWWLAAGFLCLALTLQSEFAYGVFFFIPLLGLIPWLRDRWRWRQLIPEYLTVGIVTVVTLLPQVLFELRNHFIMTTSLLAAMRDPTRSISWGKLFQQRPAQLWSVTSEILLGPRQETSWLAIALCMLALIGLVDVLHLWWRAYKRPASRKDTRAQSRSFRTWQLLCIFAIIPYPFFMIWRGNYGYLFSYYLTPHFVFFVPLMIRGTWSLVQRVSRVPMPALRLLSVGCVAVIWVGLLLRTGQFWMAHVGAPVNNAGTAKMLQAVEEIYAWGNAEQQRDPSAPFQLQIFTANIYTEQYDYLLQRYARIHQVQAPSTIVQTRTKPWYILVENRELNEPVDYYKKWYKEATAEGMLTQQEQIGVLTLERWEPAKK